jgi:hypothetical protein
MCCSQQWGPIIFTENAHGVLIESDPPGANTKVVLRLAVSVEKPRFEKTQVSILP